MAVHLILISFCSVIRYKGDTTLSYQPPVGAINVGI